MKILIISDAWHPQINGVVRTYEHLCDELEKMGCEVKIVGPLDFQRRVCLPGYGEIELVLFPYFPLKRMIENFAPDYIHLAVEGPLGWAGRRYCLWHKRAFTTSYHTKFPQYVSERVAKVAPFLKQTARRLGQWHMRRFHGPAKSMMVATGSLEQDLREIGFRTQTRSLTRGVDLELFHPARSEAEKPYFKDLKRPVAVFVGRVAIEKNLEAFLSMPWEGSKVIIGDGPSRKGLMKKYPDAVFTGNKTGRELADHYRSADVFVFPSRTDTFGIVLIEALACGVPVATYNETGPRDILTQAYLGVMDTDLSKAAHAALNIGSAEERHQFVKEHYSWRKAAEQFLDAF